jgi:hypothetical protein
MMERVGHGLGKSQHVGMAPPSAQIQEARQSAHG